MKTEYLITFDSKDHICANVDKFKSLLTSHSSISFSTKTTLTFDSGEFQYQLALGNLTDGSIYYDLTVENENEDLLEKYTEFLKEIRKICTKISGRNIIVLRDGIGEHFCNLGYPVIYTTENLMRKLISKFMAISIGYDWTDASVPKEVLDSLRTEGKKVKSNLLNEVDFIQLSTFLFKKYTKADSSNFFDALKEKNEAESVTVDELKQYIPFTNWEKYFSRRVNCNSEYLKSRWEKLYEFRCQIAHCRGLSKLEFDELQKISTEVCEKIQTALDSVGDIHIGDDEREELAENFSGAANDKAAEFISLYNRLSKIIQSICELASNEDDIYSRYETNRTNIRMQSRYLCNNKGLMDIATSRSIDELQSMRNKVVHQMGITNISDSELLETISVMNSVLDKLLMLDLENVKKLKGVDLKKTGGVAAASNATDVQVQG